MNRAQTGKVVLSDRGLAFGDGLFETLFVNQGAPVALAEHLTRLRLGLMRLGLPEPSPQVVFGALAEAIGEGEPTGVCKLIITAGSGPRGYRRPPVPELEILASFGPLPPVPPRKVAVELSPVPLVGLPRLRGLKHLDRLAQVMAQQALPAGPVDALMTDAGGRVVSGTMGNLFWRERDGWHTPPLVPGAVAGTRRAWLLEALAARITPCAPGRLALAEAAFLSNALSAWRPIGQLLGRELHEVEQQPAAELRLIGGFWQPPEAVTNPWPASLSEAMAATCWGRVAARDGI